MNYLNYSIRIVCVFLVLQSCNSKQNNMALNPTQEPITGAKVIGNKETPYQALVEFYKAFNERDIELMQNNWLNSEEIAMDNPLGGIMRGWSNISKLYSRIFEGQATVYVEYYDYTIHETDDMFYVVGRERGNFTIGKQSIELKIRTSRVFKKVKGQWKQVHHHARFDRRP